MRLPTGQIVSEITPIYPGSHFTWGEATGKCRRHIQTLIIDNIIQISDFNIEQKIIKSAVELDRIRNLLGDRPLYVSSWYRPHHINANVGGSKYSRHQYGDAIDFKSNYISPQAVYEFLDKIHSIGGLGRYYAFTHIDFRGKSARWHG